MSFRIIKKSNTLNFSPASWDATNEKIEFLENKFGIKFENSKNLFDFLLDRVLNEKVPEISEEKPLEVPEGFALVPQEDIEKLENEVSNLQIHSISLASITEMLEKYYNSIGVDRAERTHVVTISDLISNKEIIDESKDLAHNSSNEIILKLSDKNYPCEQKMRLLKVIQSNRAKINGKEESLNELIENMIFNDNIIFNLGGEFETGIYSKKDTNAG